MAWKDVLQVLFGGFNEMLTDNEIISYAKKGMIRHFVDHQVKERNGRPAVSYGLSSAGYDARLDIDILKVKPISDSLLDPKGDNKDCFNRCPTRKDGAVIIPPHGFVLGQTIEYFKIPRNITALCVGKSTYARLGLIVNVTPLEPEWEGTVTLEISNTTPLPAVIYPKEGICQFTFFKIKEPKVSYKDRNGKYMFQEGVTLPKV